MGGLGQAALKDEEPDGLAEVIIAKHRNGPVGSEELAFLEKYPRFYDAEKRDF